MDKIRAKNIDSKGKVAQKRRELYSEAKKHIKSAYDAGYFLEVITIYESMISDRLEARLGWGKEKQVMKPLGDLIKLIRNQETDPSLLSLMVPLKKWKDDRNTFIHQSVKLLENEDKSWDHMMRLAKVSVADGKELFRKIDNRVKALNNPKKLN